MPGVPVGVASSPQATITPKVIRQIPMIMNLALLAADKPHLLMTFGSDGRSDVIRVPSPGSHRVWLSLRSTEPGEKDRYRRVRQDLNIDVRDVTGVQEFTLDVQQQSVDSAAQH